MHVCICICVPWLRPTMYLHALVFSLNIPDQKPDEVTSLLHKSYGANGWIKTTLFSFSLFAFFGTCSSLIFLFSFVVPRPTSWTATLIYWERANELGLQSSAEKEHRKWLLSYATRGYELWVAGRNWRTFAVSVLRVKLPRVTLMAVSLLSVVVEQLLAETRRPIKLRLGKWKRRLYIGFRILIWRRMDGSW